jgi:adenine-specific DNA-methyltransferase
MFDKTRLDALEDRGNSEVIPVKDIAKRQAYGAYYTPLRVASILANWAIKNAEEQVLEPCFGGCDFLEAIRNRFVECGQHQFDSHIFGCDIDPDAFDHLSNRMSATTRSGNFLRADFLSVTSRHFGQDGFDVVIGNPPYLKNDRINSFQKESIKRLPKNIHECIKGRANLWAYFVMHATSFLKVGGRMAWVLPGNFLSSDYSSPLRGELLKRFKRVIAISVAERLFLAQGTEERTVVLLCDGYKQGTAGMVHVKYCANSEELHSLLDCDGRDHQNGLCDDANFPLLTTEQTKVFLDVARNAQARKVGEYGTIYIGIVLGDKKFFVRRKSEWKKTEIAESYIVPIASKFGHLSGLRIQPSDIRSWYAKDQESFLLNTRNKRLGSRILSYLSLNEKNNQGANSTFRRREIWHQPDDGRIADAFVGCLNQLGPRIVLNSQKLQATNSLYRFDFISGLKKKEREMFAISFLSTFSQLSAEMNGRQLGSGGLKLEPKGVSQVLISMDYTKTEAEISAAFKEIDGLIRRGKLEDARLTADKFIFFGRITKASYETLCAGLDRVRAHRLRETIPGEGIDPLKCNNRLAQQN